MNPTDWIKSFESSEPRQCFWCNFGGVVFGIDPFELLVCEHKASALVKKEKRDTLPPNFSGRTYLKLVDPNECCEHWEPTPVGGYRMKVMEACGMFDESEESRHAAMRKERREKRRAKKAKEEPCE